MIAAKEIDVEEGFVQMLEQTFPMVELREHMLHYSSYSVSGTALLVERNRIHK